MAEAGSSPTRMTASPGGRRPLEARAATARATSLRNSAAIALPSRIWAVIGLASVSLGGNSREILHCASSHGAGLPRLTLKIALSIMRPRHVRQGPADKHIEQT